MSNQATLDRVLRDYRSAKISRREALKRAGALGVGASALSAMLATTGIDRASAASGSPSTGSWARFQEEPVVGGTLREGYDLDFSRMDPVATNWYDPAFSALYENVFTNDPEGAKVPQIAESWEVSEDGMTVTFNLRSGLTFHSGAPLDAAAVAAAFEVIKANGGLNILFAPVETIQSTNPASTSGPRHDMPSPAGVNAPLRASPTVPLSARLSQLRIESGEPSAARAWRPRASCPIVERGAPPRRSERTVSSSRSRRCVAGE